MRHKIDRNDFTWRLAPNGVEDVGKCSDLAVGVKAEGKVLPIVFPGARLLRRGKHERH